MADAVDDSTINIVEVIIIIIIVTNVRKSTQVVLAAEFLSVCLGELFAAAFFSRHSSSTLNCDTFGSQSFASSY